MQVFEAVLFCFKVKNDLSLTSRVYVCIPYTLPHLTRKALSPALQEIEKLASIYVDLENIFPGNLSRRFVISGLPVKWTVKSIKNGLLFWRVHSAV